jgi:hypothetical protein
VKRGRFGSDQIFAGSQRFCQFRPTTSNSTQQSWVKASLEDCKFQELLNIIEIMLTAPSETPRASSTTIAVMADGQVNTFTLKKTISSHH